MTQKQYIGVVLSVLAVAFLFFVFHNYVKLSGFVNPVSVSTLTTSGTFNTSSSTIFSVQNPYAATSTIIFASISGTQGATTTDIIVATSTTPNPTGSAVATSTFKGNIFGIASVATSTNFYSVAGVTMGPGLGYTAPSSGPYPTSQRTVVVGPLEWVFGFSTSTYGGSTNGATTTGLLGIPASGSYTLIWQQ